MARKPRFEAPRPGVAYQLRAFFAGRMQILHRTLTNAYALNVSFLTGDRAFSLDDKNLISAERAVQIQGCF